MSSDVGGRPLPGRPPPLPGRMGGRGGGRPGGGSVGTELEPCKLLPGGIFIGSRLRATRLRCVPDANRSLARSSSSSLACNRLCVENVTSDGSTILGITSATLWNTGFFGYLNPESSISTRSHTDIQSYPSLRRASSVLNELHAVVATGVPPIRRTTAQGTSTRRAHTKLSHEDPRPATGCGHGDGAPVLRPRRYAPRPNGRTSNGLSGQLA